VSTSLKVLNAVEKEIDRQLDDCGRREYITRALENDGWLIEVIDLQHGIDLTNELAPEHCELMVRNLKTAVKGVRTAGAIFVGGMSPTVLGDYVAGPSHTLPTGGAGRSFAGLTVDQFQRRTSVVEYNQTSLKKALPVVQKFAELEGLDAHGRSAEIRLGLKPANQPAKPAKKKAAKKKAVNGVTRPAGKSGSAVKSKRK
jgi:histidinol dehydrogenase